MTPAPRITRARPPTQPEALWVRFHEELRRFVARWVAPADVDDILQIIYLRIHNALSRPIEIDHPRGWMFQVARSALSDHIRAARALAARSAALADGAAVMSPVEPALPAADDHEVEKELSGCLLSLIDALPEPYRDALVWTEMDGITQNEAATRAGISLSGMKSRVQRGRDRLKGALLDCCDVNLDRRRRPIDYTRKSTCMCGPKGRAAKVGANNP